MIRFEQKSGDGRLPLVWEIMQGADADVVIDWLRKHRPLLKSGLDRHGVVLLRGFEAIDSAERFEAALGVTSKLRDYVGGTVARRSIRGGRRGHEDRRRADARLCVTAGRLAS